MPFTQEQFLNIFKAYNTAVFPFQFLILAGALACLLLIIEKKSYSNGAIALYLSFLWGWIGIVYHLIFFTRINGAAYFFGILNIIQSIIFFYFGFIKKRLEFKKKKDFRSITGFAIIIYALFIYPSLGYLGGHGYPYQPTFGLPCPTTIFTFGILLFTGLKLKWYIYAIPLLWSIIGVSAAFNFGIYEDIGLLVSGIAASVLLFTFKD